MNPIIPQVYERDGAVYADSRQVAAFFGKRHNHVLRDIANILKSSTNPILDWFRPCIYVIEKPVGGVEERPFYELTKDGFTLLAMGFTGEKALAFKIAYIERFNRMEALLRAEAVAALSAEQVAELVDRRVGELLRDQRAVIAEGFVTAHDIRAQHVSDQKHGPKPASISIKLAAYAERTGNQSAMTRERGGLRPRRLFSLVLANAWLRTEGGAWIKAAGDKSRGQGVLRLVPKSQEKPA